MNKEGKFMIQDSKKVSIPEKLILPLIFYYFLSLLFLIRKEKLGGVSIDNTT